jgi:RNA polymerase sigma factor (TIGR02999 family)
VLHHFAELYTELRQLAAAKLAHEADGHSFQPTALVHEAWLRLANSPGTLDSTTSKSDFFRAAAVAMQRILVDHARAAKAEKRGGQQTRLQLEPDLMAAVEPNSDILAIHEALQQFSQIDPPAAELVCLRYFAGLTLPQAAEVLGISKSTADRWWLYAKSWLYERLHQDRSQAQ